MRPIPFGSVLVANRGEVACRVIRLLRGRGITAIAVHTPADDGARHVVEADLAIEVPSYLDAEAIVAAARRTGAEAIHPGYGFLSESPVLARACAAAGVVFVGPALRALELMGDKSAAKAHVAALGVPVVPGVGESRSPGGRDDAIVERADEVGYPLLVKPSAGGGGKGMQVVRSAAELPAAVLAARRIASGAFADDGLLLERLVSRPRHIEAQVLGDTHGRVACVGLRECSLQRRHQKVVEEAPAPYPPGRVQAAMAQAAVEIARSVGYVGAGTVEFLVAGDDPEEWYFLEMNTRLQVEHPVTEAVTGLDLVEAQLLVAAGEPLPLGSEPVRPHGHAVEARVYAERPERGFVPSTGTLLQVREPAGVRVDSGVREGQVVSADYDPMLLKVVAHGRDRRDALARLDAALRRTVILGVHTNIAYLRAVLAAPAVCDGVADTAFLDGFEPAPPPVPDPDVLAAAARALRTPPAPDGTLWATGTGWRVGKHAPPTPRLLVDDEPVPVRVPDRLPAGMRAAAADGVAWVWRDGVTWAVPRDRRDDAVERSRRRRTPGSADPQVRTPMPGTVVAVRVADGVAVAAGDVLAVVEAMKMENPVTAPVTGTVELRVRVGDGVAADQVLAVVHPA